MKSIATILLLLGTWNNVLLNSGVLGMLEAEGIIGGRDTIANEFPYIVSFQNASEHWCGGGILDEQHILTAAHCVMEDDVNFRNFPHKIIAGINDLNSELDTRVEVEVEKIYVSDRYNHTLWFVGDTPKDDVAVLKLKTKLDLNGNEGLAALDLPKKIAGTNDFHSYENVSAKLAGFGYDYVQIITLPDGNEADIGNSTGKLHQADVLIVNNSACSSYYTRPVLDIQICAAVKEHHDSTPQGPCSGDSGSPLVIGNTVIGIVSTTALGCNDNTAPGLYSRITSHVDFIKNAMDGVTKGIRVAMAP